MRTAPRNTIIVGDALETLRTLVADCVDTVITSPPYFGLRDYGVTGQLGTEASVDAWVANLTMVCREVARVLRPDGSLWLNLGDSFSRHIRYGAPPKALLLAPERLLLALAADGWIVRNKVVWAKPNPVPSSVADRLTLTYEVVYLLVRNRQYFFDLDVIREPHRSSRGKAAGSDRGRAKALGPLASSNGGLLRPRTAGLPGHPLGKNPGDVWTVPTRGYSGAHFATFPEALIRRPLLATCPVARCMRCQGPWRRVQGSDMPSCDCQAISRPGLVLDPFFGTGTVGVVAQHYGRDWLGIELSPTYANLARTRLGLPTRPVPSSVPRVPLVAA